MFPAGAYVSRGKSCITIATDALISVNNWMSLQEGSDWHEIVPMSDPRHCSPLGSPERHQIPAHETSRPLGPDCSNSSPSPRIGLLNAQARWTFGRADSKLLSLRSSDDHMAGGICSCTLVHDPHQEKIKSMIQQRQVNIYN